MRKLLICAALICLAVPSAFSQCLTVSVSGAGSHTGADWNNSLAGLPSTFARGTIYYLADGTYGAKTISSASGSGAVEIRKAQSYDNCSATGWNTGTMGSAQAVFTRTNSAIGLSITIDNVIINGNGQASVSASMPGGAGCGGGPSSATDVTQGPVTPSDCGIKAVNTCTNTTTNGCDAIINMSGSADNYKFLYMEWQGLGNAQYEQYPVRSQVANDNSATRLVSHVFQHDFGANILYTFGHRQVDHSYFWGNQRIQFASNHGQYSYDGFLSPIVGITEFNNVYRDIQGTAIWGIEDGPQVASNYVLYNNFIISTSPPESWVTIGVNNGTVACLNGSTCSNFVYVNNTHVNTWGARITPSYQDAGTTATGWTIQNNLWYGMVNSGGAINFPGGTESNNSFLNSGSGICRAGTADVCTQVSGNPFTSIANFNYTLASDGANWNNRFALGSPYNVDAAGNTYTTDRGAYQFLSSAAVSPTCTPGTGTYSSSQTVSCTNPNSGTTVICYTTNGTTPATNGSGTGCTTGTQYSTSLTVASNETLKVIAGTSTLADSSVVSYGYLIQAAASTCTPGTGTYTANQTPACTNPNSGTTIQCYTTNGTTPATNGAGTACSAGSSLTSGGTVSITTNKTLKIIAGTSINADSPVNSYAFTLQGATPTFSPVGGYPPQTVTISQAQSQAMCYTLDGSTPTSNGSGTCSHGTLYSTTISVVTIETIKAIGMASGWTDSAVGTATFSAGSTVGTGSGSGTFIIQNSPTTAFPPTSGPDNYYCSATNTPINGLNATDDNALGPQTCLNTAIANTPSPNGLYQNGGGAYTATSCSDMNNIAAGTGGFAQITAGQTLLVLHSLVATNCNLSWGAAGTAGNWITVEPDDLASLPAEGTRITPYFAGVPWSSSTGMPQYPTDTGCSSSCMPSFATRAASTNPTLQLATGAAYVRFIGMQFTRDALAFGFAAQVTALNPNVYTRTCNGTNCTVSVGVGDGTTQGGIVSTAQSLSSNTSGINVTPSTPITLQSTPQNNLEAYYGNWTVASVPDDTDVTFTQTYAQATIGVTGSITAISRTIGCLVSGTYTFTGALPSPSVGMLVFIAGVTDTSFNMTSGSVALTAYSSTSSTTFSFNYTQAGGSCTSASSSGGYMIDVNAPTITNCSSSGASPIPNGNCNGVLGQQSDSNAIVQFAPGVNHIIFDRVIGAGDGGAGVIHWAETDNIFSMGDTDNIAIIDSYCEGGQSWRIIGTSDEGHCIGGGIANNTDANAGTYKIVNNFMAASGEGIIFGGGGQGFKVSQVTVTSGSLVTGICVATCGIPSGTTAQFFAGSTLFPGGPLVNGINGPQTVTCCTTTTHTNDTFTFPTAVTCSTCVDSRAGTMAVGGYTPTSGEFRRNFMFKPLTWNPLDPSYDGGGPLPSGGMARTAKNDWELKNYVEALIEGNVLVNSWNTVDQLGAAFLLTPKNQNNNAPGVQVQNAILRYNRINDINVGMGISNALSDAGGPPYQGNTYSIHDNLFAQLGNLTLTCSWTYPVNVIACAAGSPVQTTPLRSSGPGATSTTPNAILGGMHLVHNTIVGEVAVNYTTATGGAGTQQAGSYSMVWKDSIFPNGINTVFSLGGNANGQISCTAGACTWISGTKFNCPLWGQGTTVTIGTPGVGYTMLSCNGTTNQSTSLTLTTSLTTPGTSVAYNVGTCFTPCTGAQNTCACKLNSCWNNPVFDYNAIFDNGALAQTYPGPHTQLYGTAAGLNFTNYNNAVPLTSSNWGSQFAITSGPLFNAADDGTNIGANITNVSGYTLNVDVFQ